MVFLDKDPAGLRPEEISQVGVGEIGDTRGREARQKLVSALKNGRYYASTGVTISKIVVEGSKITVESEDAERMKGSIDNGEVIAKCEGRCITFEVPARATYARVTASKGTGVAHGGEQWAWTQPFWVSVNGIPRSTDPRHRDTSQSLSAWCRVPDKARLKLELYSEAASAIMRTRTPHQTPRTSADTATYYNNQLPIYLQVWGSDGRIGWGYFEHDDMSFTEAAQLHAERLAAKGKFDSDSVVLDLGCGTGINSFMLARKYGCRVLGLDISTNLIRHARSMVATANDSDFLQGKVFFFEGTIENLLHSIEDGSFSTNPSMANLFGDEPELFTHMWSTCTIFQLRSESRAEVWRNFDKIATPTARLVVDDAHCPNKVLGSASGQLMGVRSGGVKGLTGGYLRPANGRSTLALF